MFKNRIKELTEYTKIPKTKPQKIMQKILKPKKWISIFWKREFDKTKHAKFYKGNHNQLDKIDGYDIFGTDGRIPERI
jgi:hypothetical protein